MRWAQSFLGNEVLCLPLQPAIIVLFVSHLYSHNYASSTVTSYLSAIGYAHKLAGVNDPTETAIIRQILKGYRKLAPVRDVRLPIPILRQLVAAFQHTKESACQLKMFSAECYIAFFAFIRIDEITVNGSDQSNLIRLNQLSRLMTT